MFGSRGTGGLKVGEVYAAAGVRVEEGGFHEWDRRMDRAKAAARHPIESRLGTRTDTKGFDRYDHRLTQSARHTERQAGVIRGALRGIGTTAAWVGTAGIAYFGAKTVGVASDVNESLTKNQQLFGRWANRIDKFSKGAVDSIGLSRQAALAAAGDYGTLFDTIGVGDKAASGMSVRLVKLAEDLASFNNADPSEVLEAIKSGLIGEAEPMRRFNALLSEARVQEEAYKSGIAARGATLTEQQKVQARYNLILKDTNKAHGDYQRTSEGLANTQRRLGARLTNIGETIGGWLMPKVLDLALKFDKLLKQMQRGEGTGAKVKEWLQKIGDAARDGAGKIGDVVGSFIRFADDHPNITKAAAGLGAAYIAMKGISAISRTTPVGRGLNAFTAVVAGAAVTHAAIAITRRGGILGKLAGGFLAPGSTPARPLFVHVTNQLPGGGGGGDGGGKGPTTWVGKLGKGKLLPVLGAVGARAVPIGFMLWAGYTATSMDLTPADKELIDRRTGPGRSGRPKGDIMPGTVGDPRAVTRAPVGGLSETARATTVAEGEIAKSTSRIERHFARMKDRTTDDVRAMLRATIRNAHAIGDELGAGTAAGRRALERNLDAGVRSLGRALSSGNIDTRRYMRSIEKLMATHSGAGKTAIAQNLDAAANTIRRTMKRAGGITKDGMELIKSLMVKELRMYGLSEKDAIASANVRTGEVAGGHRRQDYAGGGLATPGGWIGRAGERGRDTVHAVLGRGEAVLNHLQQRIVNQALKAAGIPRGLGDVFARTRGSKHYMAGGGQAGINIVGIPWAPGEEINASVLPIATRLHGMFGSTVTDAFDRDHSAGHVSPGHNVTGTAVDWAGGRLLDLVRWTVAHGYKTLYNTPPGTPWPGHSDHAHVEFGSSPGGAALAELARIVIKGRPSPLRDLAQRAVDLGRAGAQSRLEALSGSVTMTGGATNAGGQYNKADLARLWIRAGGDPAIAQLMAAIALAESGGSASAYNPSGASGLWQILGVPFPGDPFDPLTNARMAVAKYNSQGLGAWEAYTNGTYRQYFTEGGLVFAAGGHDPMSDLPGAVQESAPHGSPDLANTSGPGGHLTALGQKLTSRAGRVVRRLQQHIEDLGNKYELKNRRFDLTEEELINEGDEDTAPTFNEPAIQKRARELGALVKLRSGQAKDYGKLVRYLQRIQSIYSIQRRRIASIVNATQARLKGLPDKGGTKEQKRARKTLTARLARYQELLRTVGDRLGTTREGIRENVYERKSTVLDVAELQKELGPLAKHLAGEPGGLELPEWQAPDAGTDGDADQTARAESERERADRAEAALRGTAGAFNVFGGPGDIGAGGRDAYGAVTNPMAGGPPGGGTRFMDPATGQIHEIPGGATINVEMNMLTPGDPRQLRQAAGAVVQGLGLQPYTGSSKTTVEV